MDRPPQESTGRGPLYSALVLAALLAAALAVSLTPLQNFVSPPTRRASAPGDCLSCHDGAADLKGGGDPGMVEQWRRSVHFARGVTCQACHGTNHEEMIKAKGEVSAGVCGTCHPKAVEEFARQGHSLSAAMAETNAKFLAQSAAMQRQGCMGCHAIGRKFADGSIGKCNYCHTGHLFSAEQARQPEACITCHVGPDHPQNESYEESKHGIAYAATRDPRQAPTCATCHMAAGSHDVTRGITLGGVAFGGALEGEKTRLPMKMIARADFEKKRNEMLQVCTSCHATSFARGALEDADAIKRQTDKMVDRAAEILEAVHRAGALRPRPEERAPNPVEGAVLVMGTHQLYENTSPLEQRFFEMASFHGPTAWKGAYHHSPDHTHWLGNMKVKESMIYIEAEARQLMNGTPLPGDRAPFEKAPAPFSPTFIPPAETGVPFKTGAKYLGDRYCEGCHEDIYRSWRKTDMAATFGSLYPGADRESKSKALNIDPDADFTGDVACFPCHTTGYGQPGGFVSLAKTPNRVGVQCEACHGPASEYMDHMVAGRVGPTKSAGLVRADVRACVQCHHPSDPCPDDKYVFDYAAMKARGLHAMHAR